MVKNKIKIGFILVLTLGIIMSVLGVVSAVDTQNVCCEKTTSGLFCQDSTADKCVSTNGFRQAPTACRSTSFCKLGTCYDSSKGTCASNTPQRSCLEGNGTWSATNPEQCSLGCCVLGDQAAFVTLVRCKQLSADLGLLTNYNKGITSEAQCVLSVQNQDKGACVYESDFEKTCKFTTRAECSGTSSSTNATGIGSGSGIFYKDKLCSDESLGTNCKKTKQTTCLPGKDEVYFVDSCGNPANIYDASKADDNDYWTNVKTKLESCNPGDGNAGSKSCGNCNYLLGGYCRASTSFANRATYGDNICANLNCAKTQNGKSYKHGESWCVYTDTGAFGKGNAPVGSSFYKHVCVNGEEIVEPCANFRQEECIEDKITSTGITFLQAACRVNRWQDCVAQTEERACNNTDRRDCVWKNAGKYLVANSAGSAEMFGVCVPKIPPGLKFWGDVASTTTGSAANTQAQILGQVATTTNDYSDEAAAICGQATFKCTVTLTKGLFDSSSDATCRDDSIFGDGGNEEECECWDDGAHNVSQTWIDKNSAICMAMGDCGPKKNWLGSDGYAGGYKVSIADVAETTSGGGGLFG